MLLSLAMSLERPIQFTFVIPNLKKKKKKGTDGNESLNKTILKAHPNLDDLKGEGLILFNWSQVTHAQSSGDAGEVGAGISSSSQGMGGGSAPDFYF